MLKASSRFVALSVLAGLPASVLAENFDFTYTGSAGVSAFGSLTATSNGDGTFTATSGFITVTGGAVMGTWNLVTNPGGTAASLSPFAMFIFDNQLLPVADPKLTTSGLLFSDGIVEVNIWGNSPGSYSHWEAMGGGYAVSSDGQFTLTPAPGSVALLGLGGVVAARRRR